MTTVSAAIIKRMQKVLKGYKDQVEFYQAKVDACQEFIDGVEKGESDDNGTE